MKPPANSTYTYNGVLQCSTLAVVQSPSSVVLTSEVAGDAAYKGYAFPSPILDCNLMPMDKTCRWQPPVNRACATGVNGYRSLRQVAPTGVSYKIYSGGVNYVYCDNHAKRHLINASPPLTNTDSKTDPYRQYDATGVVTATWKSDGCFGDMFKPDYQPQVETRVHPFEEV